VSAEDLADEIELATRSMSQTAVQQATGLSARTLRDLLSGIGRRYRRETLDKLDEPLGWEPGHAWRIYRQTSSEQPDERMLQIIAVQIDQIRARVSSLEEAPTWAGEVLDAFRPLRPEDRATLLAMARRLDERRR